LLAVLQVVAVDAKTIVDVGANVGFFTLSLAASTHAIVHAVEPQPRLGNLIERSARASNLQGQVRLHRFALSDSDGERRFFIDHANLGGSKISSDVAPERTIQVPVRAGSNFLDSLGVPEIDLVKVDVEGHEKQVLHSIESWLARHAIRAIVFEARGHGEDGDAMQLLSHHGYELLGIEKGLRSPRISEGPSLQRASVEDMLAVRPRDFQDVKEALKGWMR
jgi:FkbM family methyltransferase